MITLPLRPTLAVRIQSPVPSDDGTCSVRQDLAHGKHLIVVLLADLKLSPGREEVAPGPSGQLGDCDLRLAERVAEEDGPLELLGPDANFGLGEPGD